MGIYGVLKVYRLWMALTGTNYPFTQERTARVIPICLIVSNVIF